MMATALGAAVSDALEDGRVVSGVGGQYNFVAMAHALPDARSVLMLRASREAGGRDTLQHGVELWPHHHPPPSARRLHQRVRHRRRARAQRRGLHHRDGRHRRRALPGRRCSTTAKANGKLRGDFALPAHCAGNTARGTCARRWRRSAPTACCPTTRSAATSPPVEQRLVKALGWLKGGTATPRGQAADRAAGDRARAQRATTRRWQRMGLEAPPAAAMAGGATARALSRTQVARRRADSRREACWPRQETALRPSF